MHVNSTDRPAFRAAMRILTFTLAAGLLGSVGPALAKVSKAAGGTQFTYSAPHAGSVSLAGEFNGWNGTANPMTKSSDGVWSVVVQLGAGEHTYKFVVDGQWVADPDNPVTAGEFGNSVVTLGADGAPLAMKATSNTELSPKVFLSSRYITLMQSRESDRADRAWNFERPDFDVDLDFQIRFNEVLGAHVLTNINNINQNVQLWETNLSFDRGSLTLESEDLNLMMFDNDSVGVWGDPLHLVGDVGIYHHPWGLGQQGLLASRAFGPVNAKILYSDNFAVGGTTGPTTDALLDNLVGVGIAAAPGAFSGSAYGFSESDNNKDVLALRVDGELRPGLRGGLSFRTDRGANPGALVELVEDRSTTDDARAYLVNTYGQTVENWMAGGADVHYFDDPRGIELMAEFLVGEASVSAVTGEMAVINVTGIDTTTGVFAWTSTPEETAPGLDGRLNTSRRFALGAHYFAYRGWHWMAGVKFQDHDLVSAPGFSSTRYNRVTTYDAGIHFSGDEWKRWPWELGVDVTYHDFSYGAGARWTDQLWFDDTNFWLEQGEHLVTVDRLVMLGGRDVVSWRPRARWTFHVPRNATVTYNGILNSTDIGRKPKYWENRLGFHVDLTPRLGLNTDTRLVTYDDPVLELDETFQSHFVELKYFFTPTIEVGLSWGVDPTVIDAPTNQYADIGRDLFLFDRGANGSAAKTRFLDMSETIRRAEQALEDENRFQLEAIMRF